MQKNNKKSLRVIAIFLMAFNLTMVHLQAISLFNTPSMVWKAGKDTTKYIASSISSTWATPKGKELIMLGIYMSVTVGLFCKLINSITNNEDLRSDGKFVASDNNAKKFDSIIGCENAKKELQKIINRVNNQDSSKRFRTSYPKGILMHGPAGNGKTSLARAFAAELKLPFYQATGSSFTTPLMGSGAQNLRAIFKAAEAEGCRQKKPTIIFIDEIDTLIAKDHGFGGAWSTENTQRIAAFKTLLDGFEKRDALDEDQQEKACNSSDSLKDICVKYMYKFKKLLGFNKKANAKYPIIVLAATNHLDKLDPDAIRNGRFDYTVFVGNPLPTEAYQLIDMKIKELKACGITIEDMTRLEKFNIINNLHGKSAIEIITVFDDAARSFEDDNNKITYDSMATKNNWTNYYTQNDLDAFDASQRQTVPTDHPEGVEVLQ